MDKVWVRTISLAAARETNSTIESQLWLLQHLKWSLDWLVCPRPIMRSCRGSWVYNGIFMQRKRKTCLRGGFATQRCAANTNNLGKGGRRQQNPVADSLCEVWYLDYFISQSLIQKIKAHCHVSICKNANCLCYLLTLKLIYISLVRSSSWVIRTLKSEYEQAADDIEHLQPVQSLLWGLNPVWSAVTQPPYRVSFQGSNWGSVTMSWWCSLLAPLSLTCWCCSSRTLGPARLRHY